MMMNDLDQRRNIKLTIAYKGTRYAGWQIQKNAPTVEAEIKAAIRKITGEDTTVYGAGRTDAGVPRANGEFFYDLKHSRRARRAGPKRQFAG